MIESLQKLQWKQAPQKAVELYKASEDAIHAAWQDESPKRVTERLGELLQFFPGKMPGGIPNAPSPLTSMLAGGMAGAGLGYGAGAIGSMFMPDSWKRHRLSKTLALLGGLAGATPGALWGITNSGVGNRFNDPSLLSSRGYDPEAAAQFDSPGYSFDKNSLWKAAFDSQTGLGEDSIDVNEWNQLIYRDPYVAGPLSPRMQAAASGLVTGAANLPGNTGTRFVSPLDIGRMAAGMGSGYLSGALVGRALGLTMGMPRQTQDRLRQTGMLAGLIANLVPLAFGGR